MTNGNPTCRRVAEDTLALMAGLGAGAGLMYLCDPGQGRARRGRLAAQASRMVRRDENKLERHAKDLLHRVQGFAAETASAIMPDEPVTDDVLADRVRSGIGHLVLHQQGIEVHARDGVVTLEGKLTHAERRRLEKEVKAIPGVKRVDNRLASPWSPFVPGLVVGLAAGLGLLRKKAGAGS